MSNSNISIPEARKMLGSKHNYLTDQDIINIISKFDYLANSWLDKKEKEVLEGRTINELLTIRNNTA